ncbi:sensory rhodopsin transducer [Rhodanobacter hydrolyticus]|uniref:Sensory rhodopsin transducer n=1 Tax=Rhodanobacter hydrolyticus TaxID=2250595 RepID=A0ABW8JF36_9GAMM
MSIGMCRWAIAEGYIPGQSSDDEDRRFVSHEAACMLNASDCDAKVRIMLYFEDRDPVGPYHVVVPARRSLHMRFNDLTDPAPVPRDTDYSSVFESDVPIVVQHTRLDSRKDALALLSTIAFGENA